MKKIILLLIFCVSVSIAQENKTEGKQENKIEPIQENKTDIKQENEIETVQENTTYIKQENKEVILENHLFNFYSTIIGGGVNYEFKMTNNFTFRTELGVFLKMGITINNTPDLILPYGIFTHSFGLSVESRFYYALDDELKENNDIYNNSGKYLALKTSISRPLYSTLNTSKITIFETVLIAGIRTNFTKNLNGEIGFGSGVGVYRDPDSGRLAVYMAIPIPMRIGLSLSL